MIYTTITTLDRLTGFGFTQFDLDPGMDLYLTDSQREQLNAEGRAATIAHAAKVLRGAFPQAHVEIDGQGVIYAEIGSVDESSAAWAKAVEAIQFGLDYDGLLERYFELSERNSEAEIVALAA